MPGWESQVNVPFFFNDNMFNLWCYSVDMEYVYAKSKTPLKSQFFL